jgi:hypothetical protein
LTFTRRWDNNIKTDVTEAGCNGVEWIKLAHDKKSRVRFCGHVTDPSGSLNQDVS